MWNGTLATLKPNPINSMAMPMSSNGLDSRWYSAMTLFRSRRPRGAVHQRDAVEQERRRERTEQEILERTLGRALAAAIHAGERVHRHRHQLDAKEHDHEIACGGEQHHSGR